MTPFRRSLASVAALVVVALAAVACGDRPAPTEPGSPPASIAEPDPAAPPAAAALFAPEDIEAWIAFRRAYTLRADFEWVLEVASDPANWNEMDVPLTPIEIITVANKNFAIVDLVQPVTGYGNRFPDEFAGVYIDRTRVVIRFTDRLAEHEADVREQFGDAPIDVLLTTYSVRELEQLARQVEAEAGWFPTIDASLEGASAAGMSNKVNVDYRANGVGVERQILAHFGQPDWMQFTHMGSLPWTGPLGAIRVRVVDRDGTPVAVTCTFYGRDSRESAEVGPQDFSDGVCADVGFAAVEWEVVISYERDGRAVKVTTRVRVPAGGVGTDTVVVDR